MGGCPMGLLAPLPGLSCSHVRVCRAAPPPKAQEDLSLGLFEQLAAHRLGARPCFFRVLSWGIPSCWGSVTVLFPALSSFRGHYTARLSTCSTLSSVSL